MSYRQPRRQGVVYGPVRQSEGGPDRGTILGRVVGVLVLLLAVAVLGGGALAFLNGRAPQGSGSPSPNTSASDSPAPGTSATPGASGLPTPEPTPTASPLNEPSPTPFEPVVQVGAGFVTFGTKADRQLHITDPASTLALSQRLTWSAFLVEPVNSADVVVRIFKLDEAVPDGQRLVREEAVDPAVRGAQIFLRRMRPERLLDGPGIYVVRYMRAESVMAEGFVRLDG